MAFLFEFKEDRDVIFRNSPYFFGARAMYLNLWLLDFDLDSDIPNAVSTWVRLLRLPLSCWNDDHLKAIENGAGRYLH